MDIHNQYGKIDEYQCVKEIGPDMFQIFEARYLEGNYILCKGNINLKDYMDFHGEFNEKGKRIILNYHDSVEAFKKVFENEKEACLRKDFAGMCFSEMSHHKLEHKMIDMDPKEIKKRFAEAFEKNELAKCFEELEKEMLNPSLRQKLELAKDKQEGAKKESKKTMVNKLVR